MKKKANLFCLLMICFLAAGCGAGIVVDSAGDEPDTNLTDGVCKTANNECTLRAAIMEANVSDDISKITFKNVTTINPVTALPPINTNNARIDGGGAVTINGQPNGLETENGIEIIDASNVYIQGLTIKYFFEGILVHSVNGSAKNNVIGALPSEAGDILKRNVIIYNTHGITIRGPESSDNIISGNHIGIGGNGTTSRPNLFAGILIDSGANNNLIGSKSGSGVSGGGNLVSGNNGPGIWLQAADLNHISGNYIGSNLNGNGKVENYDGIMIGGGSFGNWIGYDQDGSGSPNLISGNEINGIFISSSNSNHISGNFIGTRINGTVSMPNTHGIWLTEGSGFNFIGTDGDGINDEAEGNLISGNLQNGVTIQENCIINYIAGNLIGTTISGQNALGNGWGGVSIHGDNNLIGKPGSLQSEPAGNVICCSGTVGINLASDYNTVSGNMIGVDITGTIALGNNLDGIVINGDNNIIGTDGNGITDPEESNIVSANGIQSQGSGIVIKGDNNVIAGNLVGTDASGTIELGNDPVGLVISDGGSGNRIGTDGDGTSDNIESNLISGNARQGIALYSASANTIAGNLVGTDISGTAALPNGHAASQFYGAIDLGAGSNLNVIGTNGDGQNDAAEGNLISGNPLYGIKLIGSGTENNVISGNIIGLDISGGSVLGNVGGIHLGNSVDNIIIGTNADGLGDIHEGNMIGGNQAAGILIGGSNIHISGNFIGTDISGTSDLGNGGPGIDIVEPAHDITVGGSPEKTNTIAFNKSSGISILGGNADNIQILNNSIHTNDRLGIDLASQSGLYDVALNDPGDIDSGPNDLMNFPVLTAAKSIILSLAIDGEMVDSLPFTSYLVQFFDNESCDSPSGHGEGRSYIGSKQVFTDSFGDASFSAIYPFAATPGHFITATATAYGKTSEFSACIEVTAEESTYSGEVDENPCAQFDQEEMELVTFNYRPGSGIFSLYLKHSAPYPTEGPAGDWEFTAVLGEIPSALTSFLDADDRAYFDFVIPQEYLNSKQTLKVFSNYCFPPLYVNEISILTNDPADPSGFDDSDGCHSGLNERDCIANDGIYSSGVCICPRRSP